MGSFTINFWQIKKHWCQLSQTLSCVSVIAHHFFHKRNYSTVSNFHWEYHIIIAYDSKVNSAKSAADDTLALTTTISLRDWSSLKRVKSGFTMANFRSRTKCWTKYDFRLIYYIWTLIMHSQRISEFNLINLIWLTSLKRQVIKL